MDATIKLPNLVIAGVSKAGTTSLFAYLSQHREICPGREKELAYFTPLRHGEPLGPLEDYARAFSHCGDQPRRLEATPNYFFGGRAVVEALDKTLPGASVIVSLRNPVDRLWSSFVMKIRKGHWDPGEPFEEFVRQCRLSDQASAEGRGNRRLFKVLSTGFYADHLPLWADTFGDRLKVIFFEQWTKQPQLHVARLCEWLGIDPESAYDIDYRVRNQAAIHRSRGLWRIARAVNRTVHLHLVDRPQLKGALTSAYKRVNTTKFSGSMSQAMRAELEEYYREGNRRLAEQLSKLGYRDLPYWLQRDGQAVAPERTSQLQSNDMPRS